MWPAGARSDSGRQEKHVALTEVITFTGVLQSSAPGETDQHSGELRCAQDKRQSPADSYDPKVIAINEALPQDGLRLLDPGSGRLDGALRKIDAGHCLIHLKRPPAARPGVQMVPVIKPKCHVAVLLYFKNHHIAQ